ncbi:hypothetical protein [Candidatus Lucifugimonas marina]|uniref:hypothetical protein n=1 Tax=Candidatus Lucifugimonas marina TaxID=3038979 RepID=UPI00279C0FA9|nr:hypothetical protein GKN94_00620 [SAR202 cluster bacterium JH545]
MSFRIECRMHIMRLCVFRMHYQSGTGLGHANRSRRLLQRRGPDYSGNYDDDREREYDDLQPTRGANVGPSRLPDGFVVLRKLFNPVAPSTLHIEAPNVVNSHSVSSYEVAHQMITAKMMR